MADTGRSSKPGLAQQDGTGAQRRNPRDIARLVGAAVILVFLIAFIVENSQTVEVHFVFGSAHVSLIWALLIAAVLGVLFDRLVILMRRRRQRANSRP